MATDLIITPYSQVQENPEISATFALSEFPRLAQVVESTSGEIHADFKLYKGESGLMLSVRASCVLPVICQRCMQTMDHTLSIDHSVLLVPLGFNDEGIDEDYVVLEDKQMSLRDFLEDELMLALPLIAKHDTDYCKPLGEDTESEPEKTQKTHKPFANLGKLRGKIRH